jgi:Uma2 family endonuclease
MTQTLSRPTTRLLTAADLAALPSDLPSGPTRYELWEGVLEIMSPPIHDHARVENAFAAVLRVYGEWPGHGEAGSGEGAILLRRDPDTVVGADAYFHTKDQLPISRTREGYVETIPAIVAEVKSKNDSWNKINRKVAAYLEAGVRLVWVADYKRKVIKVHRPDQPPVELGIGDTLTAEGIIPGFAVPVAEFFRGVL